MTGDEVERSIELILKHQATLEAQVEINNSLRVIIRELKAS